MATIRALIFDVFGTLVDWRSGIAREAHALLAPLGLSTDWAGFADAWRAQYQPAMAAVRSGGRPYVDLDTLHAENLARVLNGLGWEAQVDEPTRAELTRAWHRLDAWPDVGAGLLALQPRFLLAPCSNGHIALQVALARHNAWRWDAVLGADIARDYKPQPVVYLASCAALGCAPAEVLMVAAHSHDLAAAAAAGLRTAHVARPNEAGPGQGEASPSVPVNHAAPDLAALAQALLRV